MSMVLGLKWKSRGRTCFARGSAIHFKLDSNSPNHSAHQSDTTSKHCILKPCSISTL